MGFGTNSPIGLPRKVRVISGFGEWLWCAKSESWSSMTVSPSQSIMVECKDDAISS